MKLLRVLVFLVLVAPAAERASEDWLDPIERGLGAVATDESWRLQLSGTIDLEEYRGEQSTTGFVFTENQSLFSPRLTLFVDAQLGRALYGFVQARVDQGFDPSEDNLRGRLDEYALRWAAGRDGLLNVQVGQFATVIGGWIGRHRSWDNPFVGAPLPYAHMTGAYDAKAPERAADLIPGRGEDEYDHNPLIWGPSYTSGASVFGHWRQFDYAAEIKNVGPASRPEKWGVGAVGFERPAYNMRLGWRPDLRWKFGVSASDSTYVLPDASRRPGTKLGDFREVLWGQDASFAWHHWQIWTELFEAKFTAPAMRDAWTYAGYVEMRRKLSTLWSVAARGGRQIFSSVADGLGGHIGWGENVTRLELAVVYRFTPHMQLKLQVNERHVADAGRNWDPSYAGQFTLRF